MARVVASAAAGVPPRIMGLGPVPAVRKALERAGLSLEQVGLVEINEAFAVQVLAVMAELGLSHEMVNVNGGAVALGHPLGLFRRAHPHHAAARDEAPRANRSTPLLRAGEPVRGGRAG